MIKEEYDFLTWTSFPSSVKLENETEAEEYVWHIVAGDVPVTPNTVITGTIKAKQQNGRRSVWPTGEAAAGVRFLRPDGTTFLMWVIPLGTYEWREVPYTGLATKVPSDIKTMIVDIFARGIKGAITWFDDLKIYQDDVLIYSDDFSNWSPFIGAGVGAPIGGVAGYLLKEPLGPMVSEVVGAVLGGALGGGVGLLTGLGIIPVPQIPIPTFRAPLEGPGAPARLGKYLITG